MNQEVVYGEYKFSVRQATVLDGIRRGQLIGAVMDSGIQDEALRTAGIALMPQAVAALADPGNLPADVYRDNQDITAQVCAFAGLDERLVETWLDAVYELNPHWSARRKDAAEDVEKKEP